jgi:hypothetical protein
MRIEIPLPSWTKSCDRVVGAPAAYTEALDSNLDAKAC